MKKKLIKNLMVIIFFVFSFNFVYAADDYTLTNVTEKANDVYVVKYGDTVTVQSNANVTVKSNDLKKASIENGKNIRVYGTGIFTVNINGTDVKFFSWNACLKNGKYWVYKDEKQTSKYKIVYSKAYLEAEPTSDGKALKIVNHITNGNELYNKDIDGRYIINYYNTNKKVSISTNYEYSLEKVRKPELKMHDYTAKGTVVQSYSDESIKVSVEKISKYYVAKICVLEPSSQVKKVEAGWGKSLKTVNTMLNNTQNAIVGCNGSGFYKAGSWTPSQSAIKKTSWDKTTEGYLVISNGEIRRQIEGQNCNALLGILPNGSLKYYENNPYTDVINDGVKNTFTFGPLMIKDGQKYTQVVGSPRQSYNGSAAKRTAIGQIDENNFVIITNTSSTTAKISELATFGLTLDCKLLYNLDGGGSTSLWFRNGLSGTGTQVKSSSRGVGDALCFVSLNQ